MSQPTNPTFSQARPPMSSTFSAQQPLSAAMFQQGAPPPPHNHQMPPAQFAGWPNQPSQGASNSHMTQSLLSLASNDQQNPNMSGPPPPNAFYGGNNDFQRQATATACATAVVQSVLCRCPTCLLSEQCRQATQRFTDGVAAAAAAANATDVRDECSGHEQFEQYRSVATVLPTILVRTRGCNCRLRMSFIPRQYMQQQQQSGVQPPATQMTAQQQFQQAQIGFYRSSKRNTRSPAYASPRINGGT